MHSRPPMGLFRPTALDSSLNGRRSGAEIPCPKCNCRFFKFGGETQSCQWGKPADLSKAGAKRCMSPEVAHRAISLLGDDDVALGEKRTSTSVGGATGFRGARPAKQQLTASSIRRD